MYPLHRFGHGLERWAEEYRNAEQGSERAQLQGAAHLAGGEKKEGDGEDGSWCRCLSNNGGGVDGCGWQWEGKG